MLFFALLLLLAPIDRIDALDNGLGKTPQMGVFP